MAGAVFSDHFGQFSGRSGCSCLLRGRYNPIWASATDADACRQVTLPQLAEYILSVDAGWFGCPPVSEWPNGAELWTHEDKMHVFREKTFLAVSLPKESQKSAPVFLQITREQKQAQEDALKTNPVRRVHKGDKDFEPIYEAPDLAIASPDLSTLVAESKELAKAIEDMNRDKDALVKAINESTDQQLCIHRKIAKALDGTGIDLGDLAPF